MNSNSELLRASSGFGAMASDGLGAFNSKA